MMLKSNGIAALLGALLLGGCSVSPSASSVETIEDAEKLLGRRDETTFTNGEKQCT